MNYSQQFAGLVDAKWVSAIEAAAIPSPPNGVSSRDHLFVNCRYSGFIEDIDTRDLLDRARIDVVSILRRSIERGLLNGFSSICVSILGQHRSGAKRRIYRYAVESKSVPADAIRINEESLDEIPGCLHSSEVEEIEQLLSQRVT